jgi:hypothetical protein
MSMIRKRSHPSGNSAKKEKTTQPETGKLRNYSVPLKLVIVGSLSVIDVFAELFEQIFGPLNFQKDGH